MIGWLYEKFTIVLLIINMQNVNNAKYTKYIDISGRDAFALMLRR